MSSFKLYSQLPFVYGGSEGGHEDGWCNRGWGRRSAVVIPKWSSQTKKMKLFSLDYSCCTTVTPDRRKKEDDKPEWIKTGNKQNCQDQNYQQNESSLQFTHHNACLICLFVFSMGLKIMNFLAHHDHVELHNEARAALTGAFTHDEHMMAIS